MFKKLTNYKPKKKDNSSAAVEYRKATNEHNKEIKNLKKQIKKYKMLKRQVELEFKIKNTY